MRAALIAAVVIVIYTGFFPASALDFARASVDGLGSLSGGTLGLGQ
jgi:hypothetical protein